MQRALLLVLLAVGGCSHRTTEDVGSVPARAEDRPVGPPAVVGTTPPTPLDGHAMPTSPDSNDTPQPGHVPAWAAPSTMTPAALGWAPGAVLACVVMPDGTLLPTRTAVAIAPVQVPTTRETTPGAAVGAGATTAAATPAGAYASTHGDVAFVPPVEVIPPQLPAPNTPTTPAGAP